MRRRALCAASAASGGEIGLPAIPDGFFPLYLTHDYVEEDKGYVILFYNPTATTITLYDIIYRYAKVVCEFDGYGYDFYPEDYDINFYLDGYKVTNLYAYDDGHIDVLTNDMNTEGTFYDTAEIDLWIR